MYRKFVIAIPIRCFAIYRIGKALGTALFSEQILL